MPTSSYLKPYLSCLLLKIPKILFQNLLITDPEIYYDTKVSPMRYFYATVRFAATLLVVLITLPGLVKAQSLRFTDTSYVDLGNPASLKLTNFTLEAWIKIEGYASTTETGTGGLTGVVPIITKGRAEAESAAVDINYFLGYRLSDMRLVADFEDNATSANHPVVSTGAGGVLSNCIWTHVAATYNTTTDEWKLYINGILNTTLAAGGNFTPQSASNVNACIGSTLNTGTSIRPGFFNGRMDEVRIWNTIRTDAEILANYNSQLISGTGLAGRWGLNEGSGTSAGNSIAGGALGTLVRNPLWVTGFNQTDPTTNSSLDFNGTEDYITFGAAPGLNTPSGTFTVEAWIKIEGTGIATSTGTGGISGIPIVAKGRSESDAAGRNVNYFLGINTSNVLVADFEESGGANHPVTGTNAIPLNTWTHVAATYGAGNWNLYINGVLDKTESEGAAVPEINSIQHASVGTAITSNSASPAAEPAGFFNGKIDEVRIWNLARSATEIAGNYNLELTSGTGLLGRWGLNENCNSTATNSVSGGVNGTIRATNISTHPTNGAPYWVSSGYNNLPPNQPTNPAPVNNGISATTSPNICATVSDPNGGNLRVRFYGRKKPTGGSGKFSIIMLPDTQYYTEEPQGNHQGGNASMFNSQTAWIVANRVLKNIVYVGGLGDCVQNGDDPPGSNNQIEWNRVVTAMSPIESPAQTGLPEGIPFGLSVGNHDQTPIGNPSGTSTYFNQFFGFSHFNGRSYYGGRYGTSNNDNHYQLFTASGIDFLVISFEYDQTGGFSAAGGPLDWAEGLVQTYSNRKVIVMTHWGINEDQSFSTQGTAIYNRLRAYPNFMFFTCGHVHSTDGEARRSDTYNGNTVHTMLSDYQDRAGGGNGLLRILEFDPQLDRLSVKTYSPFLSTYETDADSEFDLPIKLGAYTLIGEVNNAVSGTSNCVNWPGLLETTQYEWYAEVSDGENTTTGPLWTFTTPVNGPLPVSYISFTATPESKRVRLNWRTSAEINNHHFNIERSVNGTTFIKTGEVAATGNTSSYLDYSFYDDAPVKGRSFYRLQQVDIDGKFKYSGIVAVKYGDKIRFEIFPNPVTGNDINIFFNETVKGDVTILIHDMTGREMYKRTYTNPAGNIRIQTNLAAGMYIVFIKGKDIDASEQIVVTGK